MKLEKWEARDILWGDSSDGKVIQDTIIDHSRWSVHHEIVVEYKGEFYLAYYSVGATEQQDEQAWEDDEEVEFFPAKWKEKTIVVWVKK